MVEDSAFAFAHRPQTFRAQTFTPNNKRRQLLIHDIKNSFSLQKVLMVTGCHIEKCGITGATDQSAPLRKYLSFKELQVPSTFLVCIQSQLAFA